MTMNENSGDLTYDLNMQQLADAWLLLSGALAPNSAFSPEASDPQAESGASTPYTVSLVASDDQIGNLRSGDVVTLRHPEGMSVATLQTDTVRPSRHRDGHSVLSGTVKPIGQFPLRLFDDYYRPASGPGTSTQSAIARIGYFTAGFPTVQLLEGLKLSTVSSDAELVVMLAATAFGIGERKDAALIRAWVKSTEETGLPANCLVAVPLRTNPTDSNYLATAALVARNYGCDALVLNSELDSQQFVKILADADIRSVLLAETPSAASQDENALTVEATCNETTLTIYESCAQELEAYCPRPADQGFTVFLTGLPASGKSTVANALAERLLEHTSRSITMLDGDLVRKHLSSELGFSREHRDLNITRIGYVASEITKNGGIAICAPIAPFTVARRQARQLVDPWGVFLEIHVSTPIEVCEERDPKGLYAKARAGEITGFTGVDDPYEVPENPEMRLDTSRLSVDEAVNQILDSLVKRGLLEIV